MIAQLPRVNIEREASSVKAGSVFRLWWPDSASSILVDARPKLFTDLRTLIAANPHAAITCRVDGETVLERVDAVAPAWQRWLPSSPAPPHWYDVERFGRLVGAMIHHDRQQGTKVRLVRTFLADEVKGMTSTAKLKRCWPSRAWPERASRH